jgi:enoyl-CoA hydratase/carnithine racemase
VELTATRYEVVDRVATVWLHRPHRHNAWTGRMHAEYRWIMARLDADPQVRVAVVTGTPPAFCVGGDSRALQGHADRGGYDTGLPEELARPGHGVRPEWDHDFAWHFGLRIPVIAAVNGACAGIALALVACCDLRFASGPARCTTAAPTLGLPAEYGLSWLLPRLVGPTRAADLLLSGRVVTGEETRDWGLWNDVLPDGDATLAAATGYARRLATLVGPTALVTTKRQLVHDRFHEDLGASITTSKLLMDEAMRSAEYREGVAALLERRPPRFDE